jgi:large conductance mechanosensitive channel
VDFKQFAWVIREAQGTVPAVVMKYGIFIQNIFDFLIVALAIFCAVTLMNKMRRKEEAAPAELPKPTAEELLLTEIRDLLQQQQTPKL